MVMSQMTLLLSRDKKAILVPRPFFRSDFKGCQALSSTAYQDKTNSLALENH